MKPDSRIGDELEDGHLESSGGLNKKKVNEGINLLVGNDLFLEAQKRHFHS